MKITLFCFPFAGGTSYSYSAFTKYGSDILNIVSINLPGRGNRMRERLLKNIDEIVEDVWQQIRKDLFKPYAIYGHSMGTLIGYLITKKIIRENYPLPLHLFFTGCGGPYYQNIKTDTHLLPRNEFIRRLKDMGGSPNEILENDALMDFFEPIIRADFEAIENYTYQETSAFSILITCMIGTEEETTYDHALGWQKETTGPLKILQFQGDHFFIFDHIEKIMQTIENDLTVNY